MNDDPYRTPGKRTRTVTRSAWAREVRATRPGQGGEAMDALIAKLRDQLDELVARGVPWEGIKVTCAEAYTENSTGATGVIFWREPVEEKDEDGGKES